MSMTCLGDEYIPIIERDGVDFDKAVMVTELRELCLLVQPKAGKTLLALDCPLDRRCWKRHLIGMEAEDLDCELW